MLEEAAAKAKVYDLKIREKRPRYTSTRLRHDNAIGHEENLSETELLKAAYFEAIDIVLQDLSHRFNQGDLHVAISREQLLQH